MVELSQIALLVAVAVIFAMVIIAVLYCLMQIRQQLKREQTIDMGEACFCMFSTDIRPGSDFSGFYFATRVFHASK